MYEAAGAAVVITVLLGIRLLSSPRRAVMGNRLGSLAMLGAVALVLWHRGIIDAVEVYAAMGAGAVIGGVMALRVSMIRMPQMVGFLNGLGGGSSMLVALAVLLENHSAMDTAQRSTGFLALIIGAVTLSGSIVAVGKLYGRLPQRPVRIARAGAVSLIVTASLIALMAAGTVFDGGRVTLIASIVIVLSFAFGVHFTLPIGGADMPIAISLLNSYSGLAASICGFAMNDMLLVAIGAIVGAAGLILTRIMCRAMNRSLIDVLSGGGKTDALPSSPEKVVTGAPAPGQQIKADSPRDPADILKNAQSVIIIPGYGMAVAQAQSQVKELYTLLESRGARVLFAIHPVAGRMPGHMNVLLAEVDIPYDRMTEIKTINPEFAGTDAVVIVGACDVVNPAAGTAKGTPIYGMPVLNAVEARNVIVCNLDRKPGYSGVENTLYDHSHVCFLEGNAAETLSGLIKKIEASQ
ncbi:MAG TPA: NAD(P)(+) transhydrogenase (Re/Si-specific) subunit beta [Spirochaetes bacterium]|nr:NAD(P)(+) transhydrogenase (Re/Si-specific) subunit beta [Spirochaetota bacterium]